MSTTQSTIAPSDLALIAAAERGISEARACHTFAVNHLFSVYGLTPGDSFDSITGTIHRADPQSEARP